MWPRRLRIGMLFCFFPSTLFLKLPIFFIQTLKTFAFISICLIWSYINYKYDAYNNIVFINPRPDIACFIAQHDQEYINTFSTAFYEAVLYYFRSSMVRKFQQVSSLDQKNAACHLKIRAGESSTMLRYFDIMFSEQI